MKAASLNHVYKLVWSHVQNAWTVVAETSGNKGKKSLPAKGGIQTNNALFSARLSNSAKLGLRLSLGMMALSASVSVFALPSDANINIGHATFDVSNNGTTLDINQTTNNLKATFTSFNIAANERVNLNQQAGYRAMFYVDGPASKIEGKFNVSNMLLFVNPNGVYFANGSEVNVGSIIVTSLKISDDDFLAGRYKFTGTGNIGDIVNHGTIKAKDEGYIVLLGKSVENTGTLVANKGSVVLGAAQEASLDFFGNGLVKAKLSGDALQATIKNSGEIYANGGLVQMATNARSSAINISGIVEANQLVERDGMIRLEGGDNAKVQVTGQLIAKGQNTTGGTIEVTGEQVALLNGAVLNASGDTGGGTILVGGDYQGKNDAVYNSRTTYVAEGATMKADAIHQGNGGKVVVWGNDLTRYYGSISAQGGAIGGNGGFVEVSGKQNLAFLGKVDVGAENGIGGTVLLDPENIVLVSSNQPSPPNNANGTPDVAFADNAGGTTTIQVDDVKGFSELYLQANNNITVSNPLTMNTNGNIRFEANNDINVNAALTTRGKGTIDLKADADNSGAGNLAIGANITAPGGIVLSAATLTHTAGNISSNGDIFGGDSNGNGSDSGKAGNVTITVAGLADLGTANITANGRSASSNTNGFNGGNVVINAGSLNMTGNINTSGSAAPTPTSLHGGQGGAVTISTIGDAKVGNISTGAGNAGLSAHTPFDNIPSGAVSITSSNGSIVTKNIITQGGYNSMGNSVALAATNGSVTTEQINTSAGLARVGANGSNAGNVLIKAGTGVTTQAITAIGADSGDTAKGGGQGGAVTITTVAGDVAIGNITTGAGSAGSGTNVSRASGSVTISSGAGNVSVANINIQGGYNSVGANLTVDATGTVTTGNINTSAGLARNNVDGRSAGIVTINAGTGITTQDIVASGADGVGSNKSGGGAGAVTLNTTSGDISMAAVTQQPGAKTGSGIAGNTANLLVQAGRDVVLNGNINGSKTVQLVAGRNFINAANASITTAVGGNWTIYSATPVGDIKGSNLLATYNYKQYGTTFGGTLLGTGNGFVHKVSPTVTATLNGTSTKVVDGNNVVTDLSGLTVATTGAIDGDVVTVSPLSGATFNDALVGAGKPITGTYNVVSAVTAEGKQIFNPGAGTVDGYNVSINSTATGSITALPVTPTPTGFASPRDSAGLGGLIPNNPILNTMFIVSLNPAAGDEEDLDAVACPTPEDHLGSTPILSSGVKLPDGVNSNCI